MIASLHVRRALTRLGAFGGEQSNSPSAKHKACRWKEAILAVLWSLVSLGRDTVDGLWQFLLFLQQIILATQCVWVHARANFASLLSRLFCIHCPSHFVQSLVLVLRIEFVTFWELVGGTKIAADFMQFIQLNWFLYTSITFEYARYLSKICKIAWVDHIWVVLRGTPIKAAFSSPGATSFSARGFLGALEDSDVAREPGPEWNPVLQIPTSFPVTGRTRCLWAGHARSGIWPCPISRGSPGKDKCDTVGKMYLTSLSFARVRRHGHACHSSASSVFRFRQFAVL